MTETLRHLMQVQEALKSLESVKCYAFNASSLERQLALYETLGIRPTFNKEFRELLDASWNWMKKVGEFPNDCETWLENSFPDDSELSVNVEAVQAWNVAGAFFSFYSCARRNNTEDVRVGTDISFEIINNFLCDSLDSDLIWEQKEKFLDTHPLTKQEIRRQQADLLVVEGVVDNLSLDKLRLNSSGKSILSLG